MLITFKFQRWRKEIKSSVLRELVDKISVMIATI